MEREEIEIGGTYFVRRESGGLSQCVVTDIWDDERGIYRIWMDGAHHRVHYWGLIEPLDLYRTLGYAA